MIVYAMRHGEAETKAESPKKSDQSRRLTSEGRKQVKNVCEVAKTLGARPNVIISSPFVRAKQTAEIASGILNTDADLKSDNCLEPGSSVDEIYMALSKLKKNDEVVLVTHLPILGHFIADFVSWKGVPANLEMENGAMMKIVCKGTLPKSGSGEMIWLLPKT
ncbi:MAG: phosphohistidine phosphatase SixA [Nitrososphaerales archaeon]